MASVAVKITFWRLARELHIQTLHITDIKFHYFSKERSQVKNKWWQRHKYFASRVVKHVNLNGFEVLDEREGIYIVELNT